MKKTAWAISINVAYWFPKLLQAYTILNLNPGYLPGNYLMIPVYYGVDIAIFYLFYFLFFPVYLSNRKVFLFAIGGLLVTSLTTVAEFFFLRALTPAVFNNNQHLGLVIGDIFLKVVYSAVAACLIRGFINWYADIRYKKDLERKNLEIELALLKAQINPHFLFNTLNNIDVLIEKDAQRASIYLKKLSDILRFTLYESPLAQIELKQEINYIKQYIELQKIRTANPDFVELTLNGDPDNLKIAPMLFIPYIENAFKHSTNKKISKAIEISIGVLGNTVIFTCSNAYDEAGALKQQHSGLGLELISNRLNLLYKDAYVLDISQADGRFTVTLAINQHGN
ncbi:sensor histidine kinase [Mucilaginibacter flavus]|uniref:sensor histidine kinase n=1 Tax=Mucilaginibacter flavus TaxID=931504 RepID=UPI0025B2C96A|nr:sensor histidine kinase [Mucilaginibacter flavus]MDN3580144.1 sensor histidine kinase [Mucilaginibacter flavus]